MSNNAAETTPQGQTITAPTNTHQEDASGNLFATIDLREGFGRPRTRRRGAGRPRLERTATRPLGYQDQFEETTIAGQDIVEDAASPHAHRHVLPPMNATCSACGARVWSWETRRQNVDGTYCYSICCGYGVVELPPVLRPPEPLRSLLIGTDEESSTFREQIRLYNGTFAFASLGVDRLDQNYTNARGGAYSFRIQGTVYHRISSIVPQDGRPPRFAQIYIYDPQEQAAIRQTVFPDGNLDRALLLDLQAMLDENNQHVQTFRTAAERLRGAPGVNLGIRISGSQRRGRQYAAPTADEIAVLIVDNPGEDATYRDVVLFRRDGGMQRINETSSLYDPLHYVLMFPNAENGWSEGIPLRGHQHAQAEPGRERHGRQGTVSVRQFYAYRIQERGESLAHLYGRLWHQYIVDMYAKIEHRRMHYYRSHQRQLRVELYSGMADALQQDVGEDNNELARNLGRRVILPSSHTGSPRYMHQLYQDAMAIVRHFGKPDLFITVTCNPEWPEIREALASNGQQPSDRPDLIARVFSEKIKLIMADLKDHNVLGNVVAWVQVIEFQKRGLPHAHIVLIMHDDSKIRTVEDVDNIVSAEIPDPQRYPQAYATVTRNMIHTPCGSLLNPRAICMSNGSCSKRFPKPFANETRFDENGNITYRRRDMPDRTIERIVNRTTYNVGNGWVVPYNLYLTTKYNAHINVEICSSNRAVKYLYKYVYKGSDRAEVTVGTQSAATVTQANEENVDEIDAFLNVRYVSAAESCWRIFEKDMQSHFPAVKRLDIHLPSEENVYFEADADVRDLQRAARNRSSTLVDWFALNQRDPDARQYLYVDIYSAYTHSRQRGWYRRGRMHNRGVAPVSRLYFVQPRDLEKYSLRLLLLHVPGATSFEDIRTFEGTVYPTFKAAAQARGLLQDDDEWNRCFGEAVEVTTSASRLRDLFAVILAFCDILTPGELWERYADDIAADFLENRRRQLQAENGQQHVELLEEDITAARLRALEELAALLPQYGRSLIEFTDMPQLPALQEGNHQHTYDRLLQQETRYNRVQLRGIVQRSQDSFNDAQRDAYNAVVQSIEEGEDPEAVTPEQGRVFFLDGPGGTGKTFVYSALLAKVRSDGEIAIPVASSGIAATLLQGGRTAHSRFGLPLDLAANTISTVQIRSPQAQILRQAKLIIWDEAPMCHRFGFETVDRLLREIMGVTDRRLERIPFGGKTVVIGGDFRQTLPIVPNGNKADIIDASLIKSYLFVNNIVRVLRLTENMRVQQSPDPTTATQLQQFAEYLLRVGEGREPGTAIPESDAVTISLPSESCVVTSSLASVVRSAYPDLDTNYTDRDYMTSRAILAPYNDDIRSLNDVALSIFPGETHEYLSSDKIVDSEAFEATHPPEYLHTITLNSYPPHQLSLKRHQPIMLLRNINPQKGLCNGTRLVCRNLLPHVIEAEIAQGDFAGDIVYIPRISLYSKENDLPFKLCRHQFPVVPAFAMTINKSQGQTLNRAMLCLFKPAFAHGQLYVALSRVRTPNSLTVFLLPSDPPTSQPSHSTLNIVHREALTTVTA